MLVVYAATRNLYQYLPMTVGSLLRHNPTWRVLIYCEDDTIETLQDERVSFVNMNKMEIPLPKDNPNMNSHWGPFALIRCCLPQWLLNENRILWLDVDTCVVGSLKRLEEMEIQKKAIGAVVENRQPPAQGYPKGFCGLYINSGVLLMNLQFIRENLLDQKWLGILRTERLAFPDQDVINIVCNGMVEFLDVSYNFSPNTVPLSQRVPTAPRIYHYTFKKIWDDPNVLLWRKYYIKKLGDSPELKV